jgi:hypothetical protein
MLIGNIAHFMIEGFSKLLTPSESIVIFVSFVIRCYSYKKFLLLEKFENLLSSFYQELLSYTYSVL